MSYRLPLYGKIISEVQMKTGHGHTLYIDLKDGTQLVIWAFNQPDRLQMVLWDPNTKKIIEDYRSADCKAYTDKMKTNMPSIFPNLPFRVYHNGV